MHALPGIGRSTAGAILSQAWNDRFPILDGNVKRVLARFHGVEGFPGLPAVEKQLWALAQAHVDTVPAHRLADYTQAQMDFGATLCTRSKPACAICPMQDDCVARCEGRTDVLPTPKPGKVIPERSAVFLLLRNARGELLLHKRPPTGIWASLWSLPQADDLEQARSWFDGHLQGDFEAAEALPDLLHVFTHYRLHMQPLAIAPVAAGRALGDNANLRWVTSGELATLGLPAPIRKLLST